jgi:sec-independent protein translocase protein TatB
MFDIGWSELMVIAVVAIVVIGPKDLPRVMRLVGRWSGKLKRMARDFQGQFNEALREAELDEVRKDIVDIGKGLSQEMAKAGAAIEKSGADINKDMTIAAPAVAAPSADSVPAAEAPAPAAEPAEAVPTAEPPPSPEPAGAAVGEVKP